MGFQLRYESSDVSNSKWSYMVDECGGGSYYSTTGGIIDSPSYPENYPDNADCIYTIYQPTGTVILLKFLSMDTEKCCDYLEIRDGPSEYSTVLGKLYGNKIPDPIQSSQKQLWMK